MTYEAFLSFCLFLLAVVTFFLTAVALQVIAETRQALVEAVRETLLTIARFMRAFVPPYRAGEGR